MRKSLIVAATELANYVRTKAFIIGIVLAPTLGLGMIVIERALEKQNDTVERRFAVVDHTGVLGPALVQAASARNALLSGPKPSGPRFVPLVVAPGDDNAATLSRLSEQVRKDEIFAFVEIPAGMTEDTTARPRYYSNHATYATLPRWIEQMIGAQVISARLKAAAIDPGLLQKVLAPVKLDELGLVERDAAGGLRPAQKVDRLRAVGVPVILMMLIFMPVMTICPQLMQSVLEEKMSRISEVMLGSLKPFELMLGKLLGAGAVCIVITLTYVGAAAGAAVYWGYGDVLKPGLLAEFMVFLSLAMLFYSSLFISIGSACTSLKDTQTLMTPVMLVAMTPILFMSTMMRTPDSSLAVAMSLFPPCTPYLMMFRLALDPGPPLWQVLLSILLTAAATVGVVWAAGRIFRVGLLAQGKAPSFAEMIKWVRA